MSNTSDNRSAKVIVGAFIFNDNNELLLLKVKKWRDKYVCPGGHVEYNEKLQDAVKREVKEETGLKLKDVEFLDIGEAVKMGRIYKGDEDHHVFINFKAKAIGDKVKLDDEASKYKWLKVDEWKKRTDLGENIANVLEKLSEDSYEARYKRALADYQNLLRQSQKEKQEFAKYANESLLQSLLPVYDNLKTSLEHTDESIEGSPWLEGVKYVVKQFSQALEDSGVEEIETVGQKFDHHTMEAMSGKGDKVKKEIRPGYKLNGKVVVPARVELE